MNPAQVVAQAFQWTFIQLSQGKFLKYFIPGLVLACLFFWWIGALDALAQEDFWSDDSWFGSLMNRGSKWAVSMSSSLLKQIFVFFVLILLSPLNAFLSEAVEEALIGRTFGFDIARFILEVIRMCGVVLTAIVLQLFIMGGWALLSWIFGLDFFDQIMYFLIASFFYGFSFFDYSLERHSIGIVASFRFARKNWVHTILIGGIFALSLSIPIFGLPIASVLITIISTHVFLRLAGALKASKKN